MARGWSPLAGLRRLARSWLALLALSFRADPVRLISVLILAPVAGVATNGYALALKWLLDAVVSHNHRYYLLAAGAVAAAVIGVQLLAVGTARLRLSLQQRVGHLLDREVLSLCTGGCDLAELESPEFQDHLELIRRNRGSIVAAMSSLIENLRTSAQLISVILLLFAVDPRLIVLPLFALPALVFAGLGQRYKQRNDALAAEPARRRRWLLDLATGSGPAKELRIYGLTGEIRGRLRTAQRLVNDLDQAARVRAALLDLAGWLIFSAGLLGGIALVLRQATTGRASAGDVVLLITVASQLDSTIATASQLLGWLRQSCWAASHYLWVVDVARRTSDRDGLRDQQVSVLKPADLVLDQVSFGYPGADAPVLQELSLRIPAGSTVAVVGENGAGKSTLVKLLSRLYEPSSGRLLLGELDLSTVPVAEWRGELAVGFQDFCRFEFTVGETVGVGDLDLLEDEAAVAAAVRGAGADTFVRELPSGLRTQLGRTFHDGRDLSMGQWQKLAVARTTMRPRPRLLILDEPTGSLDPHSEQLLLDGYFSAAPERPGTITIVVSHRFSTVRDADLIIVLDAGRIIEVGSHEQLIALGGTYADLYELQAAGYRVDPAEIEDAPVPG